MAVCGLREGRLGPPCPRHAHHPPSLQCLTSAPSRSSACHPARRRKGARLVARAASASAPKGAPAASPRPVELPNSREDAVKQAAESAAAFFGPSSQGKKRSKGFGPASAPRIALEIPVVDTGQKELVALTKELLSQLPPKLAASFTVVFGDVEGALLASDRLRNPVVSLEDAEDSSPAERYLLVGGTAAQAPAAADFLRRRQSAAVLALNAECLLMGPSPQGGPRGGRGAPGAAFTPAYCFFPVVVKAFVVSSTEGVVFRRVRDPAQAASAPWLVFKKTWNSHTQIGQLKQRPTNEDIETVFINAGAAENPVNKGIGAVRGLFDRRSK